MTSLRLVSWVWPLSVNDDIYQLVYREWKVCYSELVVTGPIIDKSLNKQAEEKRKITKVNSSPHLPTSNPSIISLSGWAYRRPLAIGEETVTWRLRDPVPRTRDPTHFRFIVLSREISTSLREADTWRNKAACYLQDHIREHLTWTAPGPSRRWPWRSAEQGRGPGSRRSRSWGWRRNRGLPPGRSRPAGWVAPLCCPFGGRLTGPLRTSSVRTCRGSDPQQIFSFCIVVV